MKQHPTLYKRTSTGAIQTWFVEQDGGNYRTTSGQLYGKLTTTKWTECEAKNVGKKNELAPEQQADRTIASMYKKKRRTDYFDDVDAVDNVTRTKPMLATPLDQVDLGDEEEVLVQLKFDGFRCIARKDGLFTREGLKINTVPHIDAALSDFFGNNPDVILDGELYNHKYCDNFNKISSILRKEDPSPEEAALAATMEYHVYDVPSSKSEQEDRVNEFHLLVKEVGNTQVIAVTTLPALVRDLPQLLDKALEWKYEGIIARVKSAKYQNKRTKDLIKVKKRLEEDYTIKQILDGKGNRAEIAASVLMQNEDGEEFSVGVIGDEQYCRNLFDNRDNFRGQRGSVIFLNYTPRGVPRGGKLKAVRWG